MSTYQSIAPLPPVWANAGAFDYTIEVKSCPRGWDIEMYSTDGCGLPGLNTHAYYGCQWKLAKTETRILSIEHKWQFFLLIVSIMKIQPLSSRQGDLMTFDCRFCPTCRIIDNKVVKSPPMPPPHAWMGGGGALLQ